MTVIFYLKGLRLSFQLQHLIKTLLDWMPLCYNLVYPFVFSSALSPFFFITLITSGLCFIHCRMCFPILKIFRGSDVILMRFFVKKWIIALDCIIVPVLELIVSPLCYLSVLGRTVFVAHIQQIIHYFQSYYFYFYFQNVVSVSIRPDSCPGSILWHFKMDKFGLNRLLPTSCL